MDDITIIVPKPEKVEEVLRVWNGTPGRAR